MAVEPFADQALRDSTRRRFISERDLGLGNDFDGMRRVELKGLESKPAMASFRSRGTNRAS